LDETLGRWTINALTGIYLQYRKQLSLDKKAVRKYVSDRMARFLR